jgi:hypothetical protein
MAPVNFPSSFTTARAEIFFSVITIQKQTRTIEIVKKGKALNSLNVAYS